MSRMGLWTVLLIAGSAIAADNGWQVDSPDGHIRVDVQVDADGAPHYSIAVQDKTVLEPSRLGLKRDDADFSHGLTFESASASERIDERYELLTGKRRHNRYVANRKTFHFADAAGKKLDVTFQVSNDGVAFRYTFPEASSTLHKLTEEVT